MSADQRIGLPDEALNGLGLAASAWTGLLPAAAQEPLDMPPTQ